MRKPPKLYLAGKIKKNDFRHSIVSDLHEHGPNEGPIENEDFIYVGPFFVSCDHGCYHQERSHGVINDDGCVGDPAGTRRQVIKRNNTALDSADLVFAYIDATDCHGTLIELGRTTANAGNKKLVIAFAPSVGFDDFWYSAMQADSVHYEVKPSDLRELVLKELRGLQ
jgi:hypothetical protein